MYIKKRVLIRRKVANYKKNICSATDIDAANTQTCCVIKVCGATDNDAAQYMSEEQ